LRSRTRGTARIVRMPSGLLVSCAVG
jgi:hypothetical protein